MWLAFLIYVGGASGTAAYLSVVAVLKPDVRDLLLERPREYFSWLALSCVFWPIFWLCALLIWTGIMRPGV